jgi:hypothetical protein
MIMVASNISITHSSSFVKSAQHDTMSPLWSCCGDVSAIS